MNIDKTNKLDDLMEIEKMAMSVIEFNDKVINILHSYPIYKINERGIKI